MYISQKSESKATRFPYAFKNHFRTRSSELKRVHPTGSSSPGTSITRWTNLLILPAGTIPDTRTSAPFTVFILHLSLHRLVPE